MPPIAKICDYGKYKYDEQKRQKEQKAKQTTVVVKEVQLRPNISDHDLDTKLRAASGFITDGNKVRFVIRFRGREITHKEQGYDLLTSVQSRLDAVAQVEKPANMDGRDLILILSPKKPNGKQAEE